MTQQRFGTFLFHCALLTVLGTASSALAVTIRVDYSQDASGFFSGATTQGQQARAAVNAAAAFYSGVLQDSLTPLSVPPQFFGSFGGSAEYFLEFADPSDPFNNDATLRFSEYSIDQDEYVIFAGGASIGGTQLASAGLGGANMQYQLVASDLETAYQILLDFEAQIATRGQTSGFAHWGGTMSFDADGSTSWNINLLQPPSTGEDDLYTVALHEIAHVLGFRRATMLQLGLINQNDQFIGPSAVAEHGGAVALQPEKGHWAEGTLSAVYNGAVSQEALYDPSINGSVRKELTLLDAAALADLGWSVSPSNTMPGDFNGDSLVDAADYSVWRRGDGAGYTQHDYVLWRQNFGASSAPPAPAHSTPEPAALGLLLAMLTAASIARRAGRFPNLQSRV